METGLTLREDLQLVELTAQARDYISQAKAKNTLRAYRADWSDFQDWCEERDLSAIPAAPQTVCLYLSARASTHKASTLQRRLSSISQAHAAAGHETPTMNAVVRSVWAGIRRAKGTAQEGKAPAVTADLRAMVATLPDNLLGVRDRTLLLLGFAGAFRRSELVGLDREDVEITSEGLVITLRRSKTDQMGEGRRLGVPCGSNPATCPVRSLQSWLQASGITSGPLFRSVSRHGRLQPERLTSQSVALIVKRCAAAAGFDPERFSGHSLRAGMITSAAAADVPEHVIARQSGHRSTAVLRKYIREASLFKQNAAGSIGL